jgi:hypothetical protein
MVNAEELAGEVRARIATHFEWLLVRSEGRTFPLRRSEIDVWFDERNALLTLLDDSVSDHRASYLSMTLTAARC